MDTNERDKEGTNAWKEIPFSGKRDAQKVLYDVSCVDEDKQRPLALVDDWRAVVAGVSRVGIRRPGSDGRAGVQK